MYYEDAAALAHYLYGCHIVIDFKENLMLSTRKKTDSVIKVVSSQNVHTFDICEQIMCWPN